MDIKWKQVSSLMYSNLETCSTFNSPLFFFFKASKKSFNTWQKFILQTFLGLEENKLNEDVPQYYEVLHQVYTVYNTCIGSGAWEGEEVGGTVSTHMVSHAPLWWCVQTSAWNNSPYPAMLVFVVFIPPIWQITQIGIASCTAFTSLIAMDTWAKQAVSSWNRSYLPSKSRTDFSASLACLYTTNAKPGGFLYKIQRTTLIVVILPN